MRSRLLLLVFALALLPLAAAAPAVAGGFQVDIDGLASFPMGEYESGGATVDASDLFSTGWGILGDALWNIGDSVGVGGQVGWYSNPEGELFDDLGLEHELTSIPVHALVQFHSSGDSAIGFYGQGGIGFTRHSIDDAFLDESFDQTSFSYILGAGVSFGVSDNVDIRTGINWHQAFPGDEGDVFAEDDSPKFLLWTFGISWMSGGGE